MKDVSQDTIDEIMQRHHWHDLVKPDFRSFNKQSSPVHKAEGETSEVEGSVAHPGRKLLIFIHAYRAVSKANKAIKDLIEKEQSHFDLLTLSHKGTGVRNTSPYKLSAEIQTRIAHTIKALESEGIVHQEIVIVGYSAGALLARKAFLYGMGEIDDHPMPEVARHNADVWRAILPKLRFVLLAGINRGWSYDERPKHMNKIDYVLATIAISIVRKLPLLGRFIMSMERGQPFVANLRVQWIRLLQKLEDKMPPVIQLLGTEDDVVDRKDNVDVLVCRRFIFIPVYASGHVDVLHFDNKRVGEARKQRLVEAIDMELDLLKKKYQPDRDELNQELNQSKQSSAKDIVFIMHGIRDNSDWCREIEGYFYEKNQRYRCVTSSYGHFPMLHFLLFNARKKNVRWFMDQYTEELARNPEATFHFVGHSNGTYLLAEALRSYKTMKFDRVCFMGSVVPGSFPWDQFHDEGRVNYFRNDRGAKDWIVGVFPGMFQLIGKYVKLPIFRDIGDGGFRGFDRSFGINHKENYYFEGGHGAPIFEENLRSIVEFITGDSDGKVKDDMAKVNGLALIASRLCWLVWLMLATILIGIGYWIGVTKGDWYLAGYAVFMLMVLATV